MRSANKGLNDCLLSMLSRRGPDQFKTSSRHHHPPPLSICVYTVWLAGMYSCSVVHTCIIQFSDLNVCTLAL